MKELIFDMDGTIADLYSFPNWKEHLDKHSASPYLKCEPLVDMNRLNDIVSALKNRGYNIKVVTWLSKDSKSDTFDERVTRAKQQWLKKHKFDYDEFYAVPYGVNKANYATGESILIDDSHEVREMFTEQDSVRRQAIDATRDFLKRLVQLAERGDTE